MNELPSLSSTFHSIIHIYIFLRSLRVVYPCTLKLNFKKSKQNYKWTVTCLLFSLKSDQIQSSSFIHSFLFRFIVFNVLFTLLSDRARTLLVCLLLFNYCVIIIMMPTAIHYLMWFVFVSVVVFWMYYELQLTVWHAHYWPYLYAIFYFTREILALRSWASSSYALCLYFRDIRIQNESRSKAVQTDRHTMTTNQQ